MDTKTVDKPRTIMIPTNSLSRNMPVSITLTLCDRCGNYGFMSIYGPFCTGCGNTERFGSPYG